MSDDFSQPQVLECPRCGASLALPDADIFECDYCGNRIVVPPELRPKKTNPQPNIIVEGETYSVDLGQESAEFQSTQVAPPGTRRIKLIILLALIIFLSSVGMGFWFWLSNPASPSGNTSSAEYRTQSTPGPTPVPFARLALTFGTKGNQPGRFNDARSIAVDREGNIFVADYTTGRINKFDAQGNFLQRIQVKSEDGNPDIYIYDLSADTKGNLFVASDGQILKYDAASGKLVQTIPDQWPEIYFDSIIVAPDGNLYSTNGMAGADDVIILDPEGNVLSHWTDTIERVEHDDPAVELSLAVNHYGKVYIMSPMGNKVYSYNPDGIFSFNFGEPGENPGQFDLSFGKMVVTDQDYLVISDVYRVDLFDSQGNYLNRTFTIDYNVAGGSVFDMAIDANGDLYFISSGGKVLKFELSYP